MKRGKFIISMIAIIALFFLPACSSKTLTNEKEEGKILVYTTVYPLQDFTEKIGGEFVQVETVYPPGVDEHTYEPSQKDMISLSNSDLFLYIGYGLEPFAEKAHGILEKEGVKVYAIGEGLVQEDHHDGDHRNDEENDHDHDGHHHGSINPHFWLDPIYAKEMAKRIMETLTELMPENEAYFKENYLQLEGKFDEINASFEEVASRSQLKTFLVSHAAYDYWAERYGLTQLSISGMSTSQEPSQRELANIVDKVKKSGIKHILVEQNVNNQLAEVIAKEAKITKLSIHNLSVLTDEDIKKQEDYFSLMDKNIETLEKALNP